MEKLVRYQDVKDKLLSTEELNKKFMEINLKRINTILKGLRTGPIDPDKLEGNYLVVGLIDPRKNVFICVPEGNTGVPYATHAQDIISELKEHGWYSTYYNRKIEKGDGVGVWRRTFITPVISIRMTK